jgi:hypothetical protein
LYEKLKSRAIGAWVTNYPFQTLMTTSCDLTIEITLYSNDERNRNATELA